MFRFLKPGILQWTTVSQFPFWTCQGLCMYSFLFYCPFYTFLLVCFDIPLQWLRTVFSFIILHFIVIILIIFFLLCHICVFVPKNKINTEKKASWAIKWLKKSRFLSHYLTIALCQILCQFIGLTEERLKLQWDDLEVHLQQKYMKPDWLTSKNCWALREECGWLQLFQFQNH